MPSLPSPIPPMILKHTIVMRKMGDGIFSKRRLRRGKSRLRRAKYRLRRMMAEIMERIGITPQPGIFRETTF